MKSLRFASCFALLSLLVPAAGVAAADLLSPTEAGRVGMVESWRRQVSALGGSQSLVDVAIHVEGQRSRNFVEVHRQAEAAAEQPAAVLLRISSDQLGRDGQPIGEEEAMRRARMEILRLRNRGIEAEISVNTLPQVRVYTLGADGTVEARDAESGELFWIARQGNPRLPFSSLGVDDRFITFTNGSQVLVLSTEEGKLLQQFPMAGSPMLGSAIVGDYTLVPTTRAGLEGFPLVDPEVYPFLEFTAGRANAEPASSPGSTIAAWGTDAGFVYVMDTFSKPSLTFRFDCNGEVHARVAAASEDRFFFGTDSGQVYGLKATRTGEVLWRRGFDQPIEDPVFLDKDRIYVNTFYNNLFCLDLNEGSEKWSRPAPQVRAVLAATEEHIFVRNNRQQLGVLTKATGAQIASLSTTVGDRYVVNRQTDRLYLLSAGGTLQCLRPVGSATPLIKTEIKSPPREEENETDKATEQPASSADEASPEPAPGDDLDPFATPQDSAGPFQGGGTEEGGGGLENIFGDDPF